MTGEIAALGEVVKDVALDPILPGVLGGRAMLGVARGVALGAMLAGGVRTRGGACGPVARANATSSRTTARPVVGD